MEKLIAFFIMVLLSTTTAADQSVYIEQIAGDNLTVTIAQNTGSGNTIASETIGSYFTLNGNNQRFTVDQFGSNNSLFGNMFGEQVNFDLSQVGSNNAMTFLGSGLDNSDIVMDFFGNDNDTFIDLGAGQTASSSKLNWLVNGDYNLFNVVVSADGSLQDLDISGSYNSFDIVQSGYGDSLDFHEMRLLSTGDNNQITLKQETTLEASMIDMVLNGSNQIINITQSD